MTLVFIDTNMDQNLWRIALAALMT